jgi:glucose/arabinose dehydrogenase
MSASRQFSLLGHKRLLAALLACAPLATNLSVGVGATAEPGSPTINLASPPAALVTTPMDIEVTFAFPNLRISRPVVMTGAGDGSGRFFIASQTGEIYFVRESDTEVEEPTLFMDMNKAVAYKDNENEEGLLGLAFHPQFAENGKFYVYYTTRDAAHVSVISEFQCTDSKHQAGDFKSGREIMRIRQPFWNHNGGTLVFGPDGFLYVGLGDGGMANDPLRSGQDVKNLLGSILRIDINSKTDQLAYGIPADNPFVATAGARPEIYAKGIRNVWRISFDSKTNLLWAADVGQNDWEEINIITNGGNYGWSLREAGHKFTLNGGGSDPDPKLIDPLVEYPHTEDWGKSITGGAVYRGSATPELEGYYLYGDYVSGRVWALKYDETSKTVTENREIFWDHLPVFTFGQTDSGEVLMSTMTSGGRIYKFVKK